MEKFGKSQPVKRVEDARFLTGAGRYIDDVAPVDTLHAYFFRSPVAHAEITGLDLEAARAAPGVHLALSFDDLVAGGMDPHLGTEVVFNLDGTPGAEPKRPALANGRVRHLGEAVACVDAYRGAGWPEAIYVLERTMDYAARELGVDPLELRRRNFILADAFPYHSATEQIYDVGDFHKVLARGLAEADADGFAARKAVSAQAGKLRGWGLCYYIESILGDTDEAAEVEFNADGSVNLYVGTQSNGQGHETVYAQFLSDQSGIPADRINVIQGDSDRIAKGGGTGGSRSVTVQNNATLTTVSTIVRQFTDFLAAELGIAAEDINFDDVSFRAKGSNLHPSMLEVAEMARLRGRDDLLKVSERADLDGRSYPNGAHIAEVEIDTETGVVAVVKYSVTDDFGNLINPMLAEGQVHGGVAQGLGQALTERVVYDEDGQLLTASFMDYAMPRADDMPFIKFTTESVPSMANVMGMKGCGEAGTVGALAAVTNAVMDAVWEKGVRQLDMPLTPHRVWRMLNEVKVAAE